MILRTTLIKPSAEDLKAIGKNSTVDETDNNSKVDKVKLRVKSQVNSWAKLAKSKNTI